MFWKTKKNKSAEFDCSECGENQSDWPALTFKSPANYHFLSEKQKLDIGILDSDFCEIHYKDQIDYFIRVTLVQKVNKSNHPLNYGLWVSLSEKNYRDYKANFDNENHEKVYFGWLSSNISEYGNTLAIPCDVKTKMGNRRPEIFPHHDFDHPFVRDYHKGISKQEAQVRINAVINRIGKPNKTQNKVHKQMTEIPVEKNEEEELPIPHVWRPTFKAIVSAFVKKDYGLGSSVKNVSPVSENTAEQIKEYVEDYGELLIELPEETWDTSVYICYGNYWNVLIDLYTEGEGLSDLVLNAEVRESNNEYLFEIKLVYVP